MKYSYFYEFLVLFMGYNIWGKQVSIKKKWCQAHASALEAYIKKITVACSADKGDPGRLTIIANKCSIVRNAPCRMNMHPPRHPDPCPLLLPRSELHRRRPPVLPQRRTHVALRRFVPRCTCEEQGPRLPEQTQSLHRFGSNRWAKRLSTGPLPGLWYGSGGGGEDAEGWWKPQSSLFEVCKELGE
jgi:hypothetical protein